VPLLATL